MNRLTKKCMIASAGMHGLLILVLLLSSAFSNNKKVEPMPEIIELVNFKVTDGKTSGGGNPTVQEPPPPEPEPPAPKPPEPEPPQPEPVKPEPVVVKQPDPPKIVEPVKIKEPDPIPVVGKAPKPKVEIKPVNKAPTKPTPAKEQPKLQLKPTVRTATQTKSQPKQPDNSSRLAALADSRRNLATTIRDKTSQSTSVETPGPGGEAYVNYGQAVERIYQGTYTRLVSGKEIGDRDDSVDVSVTIARDGRVTVSRITRSAGNSALNNVVRSVLDKVDKLPPFPSGSTDRQRTFIITFELKSGRLAG